MNDPQYVEAARVIGERMIREGGATPQDRLMFGFRLVTSRRPNPEELRLLEQLYRDEHAGFVADGASAGKLLAVGEHPRDKALDPAESAAYAIVANTLLNFDEAVFKR